MLLLVRKCLYVYVFKINVHALTDENLVTTHEAEDEIRTRDLCRGRAALYQLSYIRINAPDRNRTCNLGITYRTKSL